MGGNHLMNGTPDSLFIPDYLTKCGLSGCKPGYRHAIGTAAHVVQADFIAKLN